MLAARPLVASLILSAGATLAPLAPALAENDPAMKPMIEQPETAPETAEASPAAPAADPAKPAGRNRRGRVAAEGPSEPLRGRIAHHAAAQGVPASLAEAVIRIESRFNPRASNRGNYGLMQIRHQTARGVGYGGSAAGLLDAETNLRYGMAYLAQAYRAAGGDTCRTVMRYQSGLMTTHMSAANRAYCAKVRSYVARG